MPDCDYGSDPIKTPPQNKTVELGGLRYDDSKLRFDLIPPDAMMALAAVYTLGAKKYADRNWEKGMKWSKVIAPLERHLQAFKGREEKDAELDLLHTAEIAWNAMALLAFQLRGIGEDDRGPEVDIPGLRERLTSIIKKFVWEK